MLVISRFRYDESETDRAAAELETCRAQLAAQPGYLDGSVGRAIDDRTLWVLQTFWANVGSYRRALSAYEVKLHAVPLLASAIDEPSAYETLGGGDPSALNESKPRGSA